MKPKRKGQSDISEKKFIIEFNKKLKIKHDETKQNGIPVENPNIFKTLKSYLNFNNDEMDFEFQMQHEKYLQLEINQKIASYSIGNSTKFNLPITQEVERKDDQCLIKYRANFKDQLLQLFSCHKKEFAILIKYSFDQNKYSSNFIIAVPNIDDQSEWDPHATRLDHYKAEYVGGYELVRLFNHRFHERSNIQGEDVTLLQKLMDYVEAHGDDRFNNFDFLSMFSYMVAIEDLDAIKKMKEYSMDLQRVYDYNECPYDLKQEVNSHLKHMMCNSKITQLMKSMYVFSTNHKMTPDVMDFENIKLIDMKDYQEWHDDDEELAEFSITGRISYIFGNIILFKLMRPKRRQDEIKLDTERLYHVDFEPNRVNIRVTQRAIHNAIKSNLSSYLQNFEKPNLYNNHRNETLHDFEWLNPSIEDNEEQQIAVENIFNRTSFPSCYIIFGGPGTGKSSTIVEAIAQIVKLKPKSHILVTASSNSTCDDIGNRLLQYISKNKVFRFYSSSFSHKPDKIDANLQKISNFRKRIVCGCKMRSCPENDAFADPTYEEFLTARVVIATLISCGRLVSAGIPSNHFDYIFIDEAASEIECATYIPIVGLGITSHKVNAQFVLSGDHKQLGPIVVNTFAKKLGLEMSLMERLMYTDEKYQRIDDSYDHDYVVQLKQNYRNHPAIMKFSNENFYDSQLISKCSEQVRSFGLDEEILMYNSVFPVIFHTTKSPCQHVGTSLKNESELTVLEYYLQAILQNGLNNNVVTENDIGIISPYRGQRDRMFEKFRAEYPKIEIGTIDSFQGREKKIIMMSCVRSGTKHIGFLRNEKRLNVALTRAQSLLIIIGNANTLQKCPIWNKFITYCYENKAIVGDWQSVNYAAAIDGNLAEKELINDDEPDDFM